MRGGRGAVQAEARAARLRASAASALEKEKKVLTAPWESACPTPLDALYGGFT
jgi:hypothetical protein